MNLLHVSKGDLISIDFELVLVNLGTAGTHSIGYLYYSSCLY